MKTIILITLLSSFSLAAQNDKKTSAPENPTYDKCASDDNYR
jgi:hypothetical protein